MRQIAIDFKTSPIEAGYLGEHNATEIIVAKPADLSGSQFSVAFQTNGEVIHSKYFSADEEIRVSLWQQLTQDNVLGVQLESYDENGAYIGKSATVRLLLKNSVHGTDVVADADNPDVYSEIAQNSSFRETLEDNLNTLDKLTTSETGKLLFDGKLIEGSGGGSASIDIDVKTETEDEYVLEFITDTETITTPNLKGKQGEQGVSGVYVGSGEMPEGYNVQIDPTGEAVVIPTKTSELINDSGFITAEDLPEADYINVKEYGAVGDGITNDTESIKKCLSENDYIYFPRGRYRMTEPLEINRDNITIVGEGGTEGGETYGKTRIEFESCDGIVFNSGRNITFNGVSVWAKDTANENCAFKFQANNTMHKVQISNCMIFNFKYGMSESLGDISCTIWNCSFKHIKTQNVEYAVYFAQTSNQENHFGILFEDFYSDNGKVYLRYGKYTFLNCNFGIRTTHYMQLQNSCYTLWVNCNFECDETIQFDETIAARENHCIELNGKGHLFIGCQFAVKGESKDGKNVFLIDTKTDLRLLKFINCYSWTDGVATIWYTMGDTGEAGCITFVGNGMDKPNWTGSYQVGYHTNVDSGLINAHENFISSFPDNFVYWQYGNKEIRYYKDGIVYDSHGNDIAKRKKPPVKIGAGFYLDFGEVEVTGSAVTVTYNRQVDGQVSVTTPPIIDGVPIMVFRDVSDEHKDKTYYARFQIKMWDDEVKSWVNNTKAFTLKWMKVSL